MDSHDLLPLETIRRLVAEGQLSPAVLKKAKEKRAAELAELRAIEAAINRAYQKKGTALSERDLRKLMESYMGEQPTGSLTKRDGKWRQSYRR